MAAIDVTARDYEGTADMRASYAAVRAALLRPAILVRPPQPVAHVCFGDDEYAGFLAALLKRSVRGEIPGNKARMVTHIVSAHYDVTLDELVGRCRAPRFVRPRHVAMYILVQGFRYSFPRTARALGKTDHTSSLLHNVSRDIKRDPVFATEVADLMKACGL